MVVNFYEERCNCWIQKMLSKLYSHFSVLCVYIGIPFFLSKREFEFILIYIYHTLEINDVNEFHDIMDACICFAILDCEEFLDKDYMLRDFSLHKQQLEAMHQSYHTNVIEYSLKEDCEGICKRYGK